MRPGVGEAKYCANVFPPLSFIDASSFSEKIEIYEFFV